ncbi:MAG: hypothetical protein ACE5QF_04300 [Thermoplasmata archaeon]
MNERVRFIIVFVSSLVVLKVIGEVIHEVLGHGTFVLAFGGEITAVHISLLWPYELSHISWVPPAGGFEPWQEAWIHGGGILVCLLVSTIVQLLLLLRVLRDWRLTVPLLWLGFWTFLNPAGYLIMGGIGPFGDIQDLVNDGVLTRGLSLALGLAVLLPAFLALSKALRDILLGLGVVRDTGELRISLALFWLLLPLSTAAALAGLGILGKGLPFLAVSFLPSGLSRFTPMLPWMRVRGWAGNRDE